MNNSIMPRWIVCSKCNNELRDYARFCDSCGASLEEICPECGKMELIGRAVCQTKLREAKKKLSDFQNDAMREVEELRVFSAKEIIILGAVIGLVVFWWFLEAGPRFVVHFLSVELVLACFLLICVLAKMIEEEKVRKKAKLEFYEKFPIEAEILRKAKGEKI